MLTLLLSLLLPLLVMVLPATALDTALVGQGVVHSLLKQRPVLKTNSS